jgi:hypothetical protein
LIVGFWVAILAPAPVLILAFDLGLGQALLTVFVALAVVCPLLRTLLLGGCCFRGCPTVSTFIALGSPRGQKRVRREISRCPASRPAADTALGISPDRHGLPGSNGPDDLREHLTGQILRQLRILHPPKPILVAEWCAFIVSLP